MHNFPGKALLRTLVGATLALIIRTNVRANAPAGRYTISGGTVLDTKTKLTWQQAVPAATMTWVDATNYCRDLGTTLGGTGWRLPTVKELLSLVDYSQTTNPLIDSNAFPATPTNFFWSSTQLAGSTTGAWGVQWGSGPGANLNLMTMPFEVRCVH